MPVTISCNPALASGKTERPDAVVATRRRDLSYAPRYEGRHMTNVSVSNSGLA